VWTSGTKARDRLEHAGRTELDGCSKSIADSQSKKRSAASIVHVLSPCRWMPNVIASDFDGNYVFASDARTPPAHR
jgi:hypothetical protein